MKHEGKESLTPDQWVTNLQQHLALDLHRNRQRMIWWVLCPLLVLAVLISLILLVLDAFGIIKPLQNGVVVILGVVLGADVFGFVLTAEFC
jgi:hypothetical protein